MVTEGFITAIARQAAATIADPALRNAYARAFERGESSVRTVERCLTKVTDRTLPGETVRSFLRSWRDTHFTAKFTAAVAQVLRDGAAVAGNAHARRELGAAAECAQAITDDDLGLRHGDDHGELFTRLAEGVSGDARWESASHAIAPAQELKRWAGKTLLESASSPTALICMGAFELFHRGECTVAAARFEHLLSEVWGVPAAKAAELVEYPRVHGVEADLHNLGCAMKGVEHFYASQGKAVDYREVEEIATAFFARLGQVFSTLERMIDNAPEATVH